MQKSKHIIVLLLIAFFLSGCGASMMTVIKTNNERVGGIGALQINEVQSDIATLPITAPARIRQLLVEKLKSSKAIDRITEEGGNIILDLRVVSFEEGDQFTRWFWSGLGSMGEGRIEIEAAYKKGGGSELARIKAIGTVTTGFFGGSVESAYARATSKIAEYTIKSFNKE